MANPKLSKYSSGYALHAPTGEEFLVMLSTNGHRASVFFTDVAGNRKRVDVRGGFLRDTLLETLKFVVVTLDLSVPVRGTTATVAKQLQETAPDIVIVDPMGLLADN